MSASVLYMSMSLDGYIARPNDEPGNPGGDGFDRLHEWGATADGDRPSGPAGELFNEMNATGAVLVGRRTAEQIETSRPSGDGQCRCCQWQPRCWQPSAPCREGRPPRQARRGSELRTDRDGCTIRRSIWPVARKQRRSLWLV